MKNSTMRLIQMKFLLSCQILFIASALGGRMAYSGETAHTGLVYFQDFTDHVINDMGEVTFKFNPPDDIPAGAIITRTEFLIQIDDNRSESGFYPKDYEIWLSSESHGGYTYTCVYDNKGLNDSHVDENFDDDDPNDTDIYINRSTNAFNGENPDQYYTLLIRDNISGGSGKINILRLWYYYEYPDLPNLDANYTPPGWSAPIVVANSAESYTQVDLIYANIEYRVRFNIYNNSDYVASPVDWRITLPGSVLDFSDDVISSYHYNFTTQFHQFEAGSHTLCTQADPGNRLAETNENDNRYCITINAIGVPVSPALSSPANNVTCQATDVTFTWSTAAHATLYNFQLDDNSNFSSPIVSVGQTATSRSYAGLSAGTKYYWRVRSYNPAGYGDFSETRSFTTIPEAPGVPILNSPANSATCQPASLKLDWQDASNADYYIIQIEDHSDFSDPHVIPEIGLSEMDVSGAVAGTTYYWRVSTSNGCKSSAWSTVFSFRIAETPSVPSLSSPAAAATCQPISLTLTWNAVSGATSYDILVDNNSDLASPIVNQNVTPASYAVSGLSNGTTYYWTVRAKNNCGIYSSWSEPRPFTTVVPAATAPTPANPTHMASCQPLSLSLSWNEVAGASGYSLQVDNNDDFASLVVNQTSIISTSHTVSGLNPGTTYYWRVLATSTCGSASSWSAVRSFTTATSPAVPVLAGPANAVGCQALNLSLSWNSVGGAVSYDLKVDDNSDFSSAVSDLTNVTTTSAAVSGLNPGMGYYWKVRSKNGCGAYSDWSEVRSFSTAANPSAPVLSSPANVAACQPLSVTLGWNGAGGSLYDLMLDNNSDFSSPVFNQSDLSAASQVISGLAEGTEYFWKVRAANSCGIVSPWSATNSFTTVITSIGTPGLTLPANDAQCQPASPTLSWGAVSNATGYTVQVDDNSDFSSLNYVSNCSGVSHNCSALAQGTVYYWRVSAAGNCSVTSSWSAMRNFKTGNSTLSLPTLVSPENNALNQATALALNWENVANAIKFRIQIDDNNDFSSPMFDAEQAGITKSISGLSGGTAYFWHVRAIGECAAGDWSEMWKFETATVTGIDDDTEISGYSLKQNYPNPFKDRTTFEFSIPVDSRVTIEIITLQGQVIHSVSAWYPQGKNTVEINPESEIPEGIYIYRMRTEHYTATGKCLVKP